MADVKFQAVKFALTTGAGPQTITIPGFGTPKAALVFVSGATVEDSAGADCLLSVGFMGGSGQVSFGANDRDNTAPTEVARFVSNVNLISLFQPTSTLLGRCTGAFVADGIELTVVSAPVAPYLCTLILIGGDDVAEAEAFLFDDLGTGGVVSVTGAGFTAPIDVVFTGGISHTSPAETTVTADIFCFGCADRVSGAQKVSMTSAAPSSEGRTSSYISNDAVLGSVYQSALQWKGGIGNFGNDGFDITPTASPNSDVGYFLCLRFTGNPDVSLFDLEWPTVGDYIETGPGFNPDFGLISSLVGPTARNTVTDVGTDGHSIAVFDESVIHTINASNEEDANPSNSKSRYNDSLKIVNNDGATTRVEASGYTFDPNGWTFPLTTNPPLVVMGWGLAIGPNAVVGDSIDVDNPIERSIVQRNISTNDADVIVTGTYTGSPTSIEARVVEAGTDTPVVDWTVIDAAPSGGVFSGTILTPVGSFYNLDVRFSNAPGVFEETTQTWGVGVLIGCAGQSLMQEWFSIGPAAEASNNTITRYAANSWSYLDPDAAGAIAFTNAIQNALLPLNVPIGIIDYASSGTSIADWNQPGDLYYDTFLAEIVDAGGELEYVVWSQGENDATNAMPEATYASEFAILTANLRADIVNKSGQTALPVLVSNLGKITNEPDPDVQAIRNAQKTVIANEPNTYLASTKIDLPLADSVHLTGAGYASDGARVGQCVQFLLGEETYYLGPTIASYTSNSTTETDVTITPSAGTDITPASGITGFEVLDGGVDRAISAAVRLNSTTIRLTHAAVAGVKTVRYQYGANPDITFSVYDDTALVLPLLDNQDITGITPVAELSDPTFAPTSPTNLDYSVTTDTVDGVMWLRFGLMFPQTDEWIKGGTSTPVTGTLFSGNVGGATPGTSYYVYFLQETAAGDSNQQSAFATTPQVPAILSNATQPVYTNE